MQYFRFVFGTGLSSKIIKHDHVVLNAQRVEQVKHSLGHHWRTARQNGLATKNSLGSLGLPAFFLFPKSHELFGSPIG